MLYQFICDNQFFLLCTGMADAEVIMRERGKELTYPLLIVDCSLLCFPVPRADPQSFRGAARAMCWNGHAFAAQSHFPAAHRASPSGYHRSIYSRASVATARAIQSHSLCGSKC